MTDDDDYPEYDTGPFCRHYFDPSDCDEVCANCGHRCWEHCIGAETGCLECDCPAWVESDT